MSDADITRDNRNLLRGMLALVAAAGAVLLGVLVATSTPQLAVTNIPTVARSHSDTRLVTDTQWRCVLLGAGDKQWMDGGFDRLVADTELVKRCTG